MTFAASPFESSPFGLSPLRQGAVGGGAASAATLALQQGATADEFGFVVSGAGSDQITLETLAPADFNGAAYGASLGAVLASGGFVAVAPSFTGTPTIGSTLTGSDGLCYVDIGSGGFFIERRWVNGLGEQTFGEAHVVTANDISEGLFYYADRLTPLGRVEMKVEAIGPPHPVQINFTNENNATNEIDLAAVPAYTLVYPAVVMATPGLTVVVSPRIEFNGSTINVRPRNETAGGLITFTHSRPHVIGDYIPIIVSVDHSGAAFPNDPAGTTAKLWIEGTTYTSDTPSPTGLYRFAPQWASANDRPCSYQHTIAAFSQGCDPVALAPQFFDAADSWAPLRTTRDTVFTDQDGNPMNASLEAFYPNRAPQVTAYTYPETVDEAVRDTIFLDNNSIVTETLP